MAGAGANEEVLLSVLAMSEVGSATAMASSWEGVGFGVEYVAAMLSMRLELFCLGLGSWALILMGADSGVNCGLSVSRVKVGGACLALAGTMTYCCADDSRLTWFESGS